MTAAVSREHAKATWLTGVAGLVILAAAFVMMACAAPSLAHPRPPAAVTQSASRYTSWLITTNWSPSGAGQGRPAGQQRVEMPGIVPPLGEVVVRRLVLWDAHTRLHILSLP